MICFHQFLHSIPTAISMSTCGLGKLVAGSNHCGLTLHHRPILVTREEASEAVHDWSRRKSLLQEYQVIPSESPILGAVFRSVTGSQAKGVGIRIDVATTIAAQAGRNPSSSITLIHLPPKLCSSRRIRATRFYHCQHPGCSRLPTSPFDEDSRELRNENLQTPNSRCTTSQTSDQ